MHIRCDPYSRYNSRNAGSGGRKMRYCRRMIGISSWAILSIIHGSSLVSLFCPLAARGAGSTTRSFFFGDDIMNDGQYVNEIL